jgi:hypothetical protein
MCLLNKYVTFLFTSFKTLLRPPFIGYSFKAARRLHFILEHSKDVIASPEMHFYEVYTTVLKHSIHLALSDEEKEESYSLMRQILGSIAALLSPLSAILEQITVNYERGRTSHAGGWRLHCGGSEGANQSTSSAPPLFPRVPLRYILRFKNENRHK